VRWRNPAGSAFKHGYQDPTAEFLYHLARAPWNRIEAALEDNRRILVVTIRLTNGRETVSARYDRDNDEAWVFHCGEVQGGVGYGTLLE
jgi:hypothetical protein